MAIYEHVEDNENNFYLKQEMLFLSEERMFKDWLYAIERKAHAAVVVDASGTWIDHLAEETSIVHTVHPFGPYVNPSFMQEANRYYGISASKKSAWLQRSLVQGITVNVRETVKTVASGGAEVNWRNTQGASGFYGTTYATYALALANGMSDFIAAYDAANAGAGYTATAVSVVDEIGAPGTGTYSGRHIRLNVTIVPPVADPYAGSSLLLPNGAAGQASDLTVGVPIYVGAVERTQSFSVIKPTYTQYPTCTIKELGFTKIAGMGHYNLDGSFTEDLV